METNNVKNVQSVSAGVVMKHSSTAKAEGSQNTVFENLKNKNAKNLSERELKYLQSQGYDISTMTEEDIQNALMPLYTEPQNMTPEVQKSTAETTSIAAPVSQEKNPETDVLAENNVSTAEVAANTHQPPMAKVSQLETVDANVNSKIIEDEMNSLERQEKAFNEEISARYGDSKTAQENRYLNSLTYLTEKKDGGRELSSFENKYLQSLQIMKDLHGENWHLVVNAHLNPDEETSTFALIKNDANYEDELKKFTKIYSATKDKDEARAIAERTVKMQYLEKCFKDIDPTDKDALVKKYVELRNNCHTIGEQMELADLAKEVRALVTTRAYLPDEYAAKIELARTLATNKDGEFDEESYYKFIENGLKPLVDNGTISPEVLGGITNATSKFLAKNAPEHVVPALQPLLSIQDKDANVAKVVNELTKEGVYSKEQQKEIYLGALDEKVENEDSRNELARGIGYTDDSIELDILEEYKHNAVKNKDTKMMAALGEGIANYSKDNQTVILKDLMSASQHFNAKAAIKLQKGFANQIQNCHKDNQLAMHKEVMNSNYKEVQTLAASNIKNYDNSVKSAAIDVVYESGNLEALQKVYEIIPALPPSMQKVETVRAIAEAVLSGELSAGNTDTKILSGTLSIRELAQLTTQERREYFIKRFEEAPPAQKLAMMKCFVGSSMIDAIHKKLVYTMIARSSYLQDMVESGMGLPMLRAGLPVDAANKIINAMKVSTNNTVIAQRKELAKDPSFKSYFKDFAEVSGNSIIEAEFGHKQKYATPVFADFMKESFTPIFIDSKMRAELLKNKSTMYIKS